MGRSQTSVQLTVDALRSMLQPLGIEKIWVDAVLVAPNPYLPGAPGYRPSPLHELAREVPEIASQLSRMVSRVVGRQKRARRKAASAAQQLISLRPEDFR
jgi:hypothetical protein